MKMLIADDDITTIQMIETIVDWSTLGIDEIFHAYNGIAAQQIISEHQPDIVLCDIGMPQCDGIEVLKWIHQSRVETEFIFLTCYASFEYAREAVRYGASNYLTKPFAPDDLYAVVKEAVNNIAQRRESEAGSDRHRFTTNMILHTVHKGGYGADHKSIDAVLTKWNCGFSADDLFRVVGVTTDRTSAMEHDWPQEPFQYAFRQLALEAIADKLKFELALDSWLGPYYTVLLVIPEEQFTEQELTLRCNEFIRLCGQHLSSSPVCVVGETTPFYLLHPYAKELGKMIRKTRFLKGKTLLYREEINQKAEFQYALDRDLILLKLEQNNKGALVDYIGAFVNEAMHHGGDSDAIIHQLHQDLLQIFYGYLQQNNIQAHFLFRDDAMRELNDQAERSAFDMMRFVSSMYDNAVSVVKEVQAPTGIIANVKQYIGEHFHEDINRDDIASFVFITPNYLSKLFRRETGLTLREYINACRIKEAKRLLTTTEQSISEIALDTGFENMSYFSTVFKKACGIGPLAWRNGEQNNVTE